MFKIALFDRWLLIVAGPNWVDEIQKYPEEKLSTFEGGTEVGLHLPILPIDAHGK